MSYAVFSTIPEHDPIPDTVKKINSAPAKSSTEAVTYKTYVDSRTDRSPSFYEPTSIRHLNRSNSIKSYCVLAKLQ